MSTKIPGSTRTAYSGTFKKNIIYLVLGFGFILLVLVLVYFIRRMIANRKAQEEIGALLKGNVQPPSAGGVRPDGTPTNVPSGGSSGNTGQAPGGGSVPQPSTLPEWLVTLLWKANEASQVGIYSYQKTQYACEVSNNIMTISLDQIRQLKTTYKQWYGRVLADDIAKWTTCGGGIFDYSCPHTCKKVQERLKSAG